jgi:urease accessory protein
MTTRIEVTIRAGRSCLRSTGGLLRAQRVHGPTGVCRVGLVATTALLLGGDHLDLEVHVGPGARLELSDVAGTVAYAGRGRAATWTTHLELAEDAQLVYAGQPFVVGEGAAVTRSLTLSAASGASALIRETLVLGRHAEVGGWARERLWFRRAGADVLTEDQVLDPATRRRAGLLGQHRVIDSLLAVDAEPGPLPGAVRYELLERDSSLTRFLGQSLAESPLDGWRAPRPQLIASARSGQERLSLVPIRLPPTTAAR